MPLPNTIERLNNEQVDVEFQIDAPTRAVFFSSNQRAGSAYIYQGDALVATINNANRTYDFDAEATYRVVMLASPCFQARITFFRLFDDMTSDFVDALTNTASSIIPVRYRPNDTTPYSNGFLSLIKNPSDLLDMKLFTLDGALLNIDENPIVPDSYWSI